MRALGRDQRGLSQTVQLAVIWPVLLLATLGVIQAGLWLHARDVAEQAAAAAVDAVRGRDGSPDAARERALSLARAGGLEDVAVQVTRGPTTVSARVTASAPLIVDLGLGDLSETAAAPREQVTGP